MYRLGGAPTAHLSPLWKHLVASSPIEAYALPRMQESLLGSSTQTHTEGSLFCRGVSESRETP